MATLYKVPMVMKKMKPILLLTDMFYSVFQADVFVAITMGLSFFPSDGLIISYLSVYVNKNLNGSWENYQ